MRWSCLKGAWAGKGIELTNVKVTDAQEIKAVFSTVGSMTRVMGWNQGGTSWNLILEINFQTGVCPSECETGLSEKTGRLVLVTLPRRLEGKADEQDEVANKVCAGRALSQVRAQGTVWLFTDPPPPSERTSGKPGLHLQLCPRIRSCRKLSFLSP